MKGDDGDLVAIDDAAGRGRVVPPGVVQGLKPPSVAVGKWPAATTEWSLAVAGHLSMADDHRGSGWGWVSGVHPTGGVPR